MKIKKLILLSLVMVATLSFFVYQKVIAANAPGLKEGTYLTGQTLSVWPSWSLLGNAVGVAFPSDPINQLAPAGTCVTSTNQFCLTDSQCPHGETCVLHSPETGWSVADRRFSFACSKDSYAYRYIVSTTPGVYTVRAKFEDDDVLSKNDGIFAANYDSFVSSFVSTSIFKIDDTGGVCNYDQEISTMQSGVCGDGKLNLNKGEQCDPPGRIEYAVGCTTSTPSIKNLTVCNSGCQWTNSTTLCSNFSHCGNGVKEPGEACDDGTFFNGKYNHCSGDCASTISLLGRCGDSTTTPAYEICDPHTPGVERYSPTSRNDSCAWDCQNWGPYCGDAITQTQYEEACDGSQPCSVDGNPGTKVCASNCQKKDRDAAAWWNFETLVGPSSGKYTAVDASVNVNSAKCATANCPTTGTGKYGHGLAFGSGLGARYLIAKSSPSFSLVATSSLTVEAWIYPVEDEGVLYPFQRIVEKEGPVGFRSYDLEFNASTTLHNVRFNLWNNNLQTAVVDSNSSIAANTWTHVVGTYVRNGTSNVSKIYVNGVLENTTVSNSDSPIMAVGAGDLAIGKSSPADSNYFFGSLDELKIYNRALSAAEVQNNYQSGWFCAATTTPVVSVVPGSCGDNVIDSGEVCDRGVANNGHVCVPAYGVSCSYCSVDCQNTIDVQPAQYCGNGTIESPEKCEVFNGNIFSSASTTGRTWYEKTDGRNGYQERLCAEEPTLAHTIQKGAKSCPDCSVGVVRNCVKCGVDLGGVGVDGSVINVLANPLTDSSPDPLFAKSMSGTSSLSLVIGSHCTFKDLGGGKSECPYLIKPDSSLVAQATKSIGSADLTSYTLLNPYGAGNALISSNPICSVDADNLDNKYRMYVNSDWDRPLNFPVVAEPQPWQYDLVLSPVVSSSKRAYDLRVVVSWVGTGDFYSGVLNPFLEDPFVEGTSYLDDYYGGPDHTFSYEVANGIDYFNLISAPIGGFGEKVYKKNGVWYHGFNSTPGQTGAESFTIDTGSTGGMLGNTYSFYVRSPSPIKNFKNTAKLKVDVYLPDSDKNPYHFGTPVKTYYFQSAAPSDNPAAHYWHVFNINKPTSDSALLLSNILDINAIITGGPTTWNYVTFTPGTLSPPRNLAVTGVGVNNINIAWDAPENNGGSPVTNYKVYRRTSASSFLFIPRPTSTSTFFNNTPVISGVTYYYKVTAVNALGESNFSSTVDTTTIGPAVPSKPVLNLDSVGNGTVNLEWSPPADGGSPITAYKVWRSLPPGSTYAVAPIFTTPNSSTFTFNDTSLINTITYHYKMKAVNANGESVFSDEVNATPVAPVIPTPLPVSSVPFAPLLSLGSPASGNGYVNLVWNEPANGGSAIIDYNIYKRTTPSFTAFDLPSFTVSNRDFHDTAVINGTIYYYRVTARNTIGEGSPSNIVNATPHVVAPSQPANLMGGTYPSYNGLQWTPPVNNGGAPVTSYKIYKSTSPGNETFLTQTFFGTTYNDSAVSIHNVYYYKVKAVNSAGESVFSNEISLPR